jgi:phosphoglycolate phosphatase
MSIAAVVFDLDGTLADTVADLAAAMNRVLGDLGLAGHAEEAYPAWVGEGARHLVQQALPPDRGDLVDEALERFQGDYGAHLLDRTRLYPGIPPLLDTLTERAIPVGVLSNKPHPLTERVAAALLSRWPLGAVEGHRPGRPRKPDPSGALAVAAALRVPASRCAFVGDTPIDVHTARAAGMMPMGVLWGLRDRQDLERAGARHLLAEPADLVPFLP